MVRQKPATHQSRILASSLQLTCEVPSARPTAATAETYTDMQRSPNRFATGIRHSEHTGCFLLPLTTMQPCLPSMQSHEVSTDIMHGWKASTASFGHTGHCLETHNHVCDHPSLHLESAQDSNSPSNRCNHNVAAKGRHLGQTNTCNNHESTSSEIHPHRVLLHQAILC